MHLSNTIAAHLETVRFEQLPDNAVEAAKRSLIDAVAVSLGASGAEPAAAPFLQQAQGCDGEGPCDVFGHSAKASLHLAALANGALAHALDYEDAFDAAPMHPNAALVPAVLAYSQTVGPISGERLLTAMAAGCDLACRLGLAAVTRAEEGGWYPPPIFAGYGAIAAVGHVADLSAKEYKDAFSLGLSQITCSGEIKYNPQSAIRAVRDAFPTMASVMSVQLARDGLGGFDKPFEGECGFFRLFMQGDYSAETFLNRLGEKFYGADVSYKAWPCCRGTHAFIEGALALRHEIEDLDQIESITLTGGPILEMLAYPVAEKQNPTVPIDAKFSLYFSTAAALVRGGVGLDEFSPENLRAPDILKVSNKISYQNNGQTDPAAASRGETLIRLKDGRDLTITVNEPKGGLSNPMTREELVAKAIDCGARAKTPISRARMQAFCEAVWELEVTHDAVEAVFRAIRPV